MELESGRLEHHVRVEDHAALADERDSLARRLREADDEASRLRKMLDAEREQVSDCCSAHAVCNTRFETVDRVHAVCANELSSDRRTKAGPVRVACLPPACVCLPGKVNNPRVTPCPAACSLPSL